MSFNLINLYSFFSGRKLNKFIPAKLKNFFFKIVLFFSKNKTRIKINGYRMEVFKDGDFNLVFRRNYEPTTTKGIAMLSQHFDVFVDVGARWGYYTLLSKSITNIAIEPAPNNFSILKYNILLNKKANVLLYNKAVSNNVGKTILFIRDRYGNNSLLRKHISETSQIVKAIIVDVTTLDQLLADFCSLSILFKIDVEGLEIKVFEGMKKLLEKDNIAIIFEHNPELYSFEELFTLFYIVQTFHIFQIIENEGIRKITAERLITLSKRTNVLLIKKGVFNNVIL